MHDAEFLEPRNGRKTALSMQDEMMRRLMFNRNSIFKLFEVLFGQKKAMNRDDMWSLM